MISKDAYISYGFKYGFVGEEEPDLRFIVDGELPMNMWWQVWGNNEDDAVAHLITFIDRLRRFINEFKRDHPSFIYKDKKIALEMFRGVVLIDIFLCAPNPDPYSSESDE